MLTAAILFLLGFLNAGRRLRAIVCTVFILLFVCLCGFSPSVLRAALMSIGLLLANALGERTSGINTLFVSLSVILLFCPYLVFSTSLQLSALATLGILLLYPLFRAQMKKRNKKRFYRRLFDFFLGQCALTLAATLFTLPVLYWQFRSISLVTLFSNLIFVPIITLLLYLLPIFLIFARIPLIGTLLSLSVDGIHSLIRWLSGSARHLKDLYCYLPLWVLLTVAIALPFVAALCLYRKGKHIKIALVILPLILMLCYPASRLGANTLTYCYDGERQTLLLCDQNKVALVETGNASGKNIALSLDKALESLNQTSIDSVILTHYHDSSLAFAESLLERTYPDVFYLPQSMNEEQLAIENSIALLAKQHGVTAVRYQPWQEISVYSFSLRIQNEILHRSEHPAQLIEIQNKNCRVLAADPAVFELDGIGAPDLAGVDHLILLESPPVDKYPLPNFTNANRVHALYANRAQFDLVGCPFADYCILSEDKNTAIIQFP